MHACGLTVRRYAINGAGSPNTAQWPVMPRVAGTFDTRMVQWRLWRVVAETWAVSATCEPMETGTVACLTGDPPFLMGRRVAGQRWPVRGA